jgi:F0F1-type ATP synthase assembly protein I
VESDPRPGTDPPSDRTTSPTSFVNASSYAGLGVQFVLAILLFLYAGRWLDGKLGTEPWLMMIGVFVGAAAGFYSMYKKLAADQQREDASRRARRERDATSDSAPPA